MTSKALRSALVAAALIGGLLTATGCSDASTASAPLDHEVSTTALEGSEAADSSAQQVSSSDPAEEEPESGADDEESPEPESDGEADRDLPDTEPDNSTPVPEEFPGPDGQPLTAKGKRYLQALKDDNVEFMGDTDNNVALTTAEYVCIQDSKGADPITTKAFVTAMVGPGTDSQAAATAKADKVINAARAHYC